MKKAIIILILLFSVPAFAESDDIDKLSKSQIVEDYNNKINALKLLILKDQKQLKKEISDTKTQIINTMILFEYKKLKDQDDE